MNFSGVLFSFTGRLNRAPYWLAGVGAGIVLLVLIGIAVLFAQASWVVASVVTVPVFLVLIWITFALGTKRLHDRDKSAWWMLLLYLAPAILQAIGRHTRPAGLILDLIGAGISIWALVELGFRRGTAGPNRYGPDPLQEGVSA
jgi:uncharacterized membrane protein YhaH (DUF805 family)